jgi:hypothetical protein
MSMTWKDKLEIGLKEDAPYRRDNLPDFQKAKGARATQRGDATRSPEEPGARETAHLTDPVAATTKLSTARSTPRTSTKKRARPSHRSPRKRR